MGNKLDFGVQEPIMLKEINWLPALAFVLFGAVYLIASLRIVESFDGGYGHRTVPLSMSIALLILAGWQLHRMIASKGLAESEPGCETIVLRDFLYLSGPLVLLMGLYGVMQVWFGYVLASLACGVAVFRAFGNNWIVSLIHSAVGVGTIYILFFKLLSVYDPPGSILELLRIF
ncbi:MAG: tripartite tricarboxylate transporter TctB family protein [Albidovulum sp.]|nr:tripartite tricarboxylate transporter TctB family protein [Albidovulum sp.]